MVELRGRVDVTNARGSDVINISAEASYLWHVDAPELDRLNWEAVAAYSGELSPYIRIRGSIGVKGGTQDQTSVEGIMIGSAFDSYSDHSRYISVPASIQVTYDSGRWYMTGSGQVVWNTFKDRHTAGGLTVDQQFRNGYTVDASLRTGYHLSPGTSVFVQGGYNYQRYADQTANSQGWRAVVGSEFQLTRLLVGELFAGYTSQSYQNANTEGGFTYGASLTWFATELVSLRLNAERQFGAERTAIANGGFVTSPVIRDDVRLSLEYEPLRQLLVTGSVGWARDDYGSQNRVDERRFTELGAEYVIFPELRVKASWKNEQSVSPVSGKGTRNTFWLGLTAGY